MEPDEVRERLGIGQTYTVDVSCSNCGHAGSMQVPRGERFGYDRKCPSCECRTLNSYPSRRPKLAANG